MKKLKDEPGIPAELSGLTIEELEAKSKELQQQSREAVAKRDEAQALIDSIWDQRGLISRAVLAKREAQKEARKK